MPTIPDPLRLHVQKQLTALMQTITPADGYVLDFSGDGATDETPVRVFRGRAVYGDDDPLPMLSILETPIPLDQLPPPSGSGMSSGGWEIMIQGFFEDDKDNPTDPAYVGLADVKQKLAFEQRKQDYDGGPENGILGLGQHVTGIQIGTGVVRPPDEVSAKAYFWLLLVLEMAEDLTKPYVV